MQNEEYQRKKWTEMSDAEKSALIADQVIGWRNVQRMDEEPASEPFYVGIPVDLSRQGEHRWEIDGQRMWTVPDYVNDMNSAFHVVSTLLDTPGTTFNLQSDDWMAMFHQPEGGGGYFRGESTDSPAEAICLAALDMVGADIW